MQTVFLNDRYTTLQNVQETYNALKNTVQFDEKPAVQLIATIEIEKFDILFIAYFILFKLENPSTDISISLPLNNEKKHSALHFTLFQYGTYAYLMTGESVFRASFGGRYIDFDLKNREKFPTNWLVISKNFMLLLLIDGEDDLLYRMLYEEKLSALVTDGLQKLPNDCTWNIGNRELTAEVTNTIQKTFLPKDRYGTIIELGRIAFYKSLSAMKILSIYLDADYLENEHNKRGDLQAGGLKSLTENGRTIYHPYLYYQSLKPLIEELSEHPLLTQFVFSTIVNSERFPNLLSRSTKDSFQNLLISSWEFTKEMVVGLKELIKNVREHTPNHQGVVTGRIYEKQSARGLKETVLGQSKPFEQYLKNIEKTNPSIKELLEINVIDLGEDGVITKLLENSNTLLTKVSEDAEIKKLILEDIELIEKDEFTLNDLLDPIRGKRLNQQNKRSIAHWGFNIFSKLVNKNLGLLLGSTKSRNPSIQRDEAAISPAKVSNYVSDIRNGTIFQLIFPIIAREDFVPHFASTIELPSETTETDIRGLETLFKVHLLNWKSPASSTVQKHQINLFDLQFPKTRVSDRVNEDELWQLLSKTVKRAMTKNPETAIIYHANLDLVTLDSSQLFRLLGNWEDHFRNIPLLISGIENSIYDSFIQLNKDFYDRYSGMSFWNNQAGIVIYSYTLVRGDRFYFADVLWGDTLDEYLVINKLIERTNFNFTSSFMSDERIVMAKIKQYPVNPAFFNRHVLLPFDILLESNLGLTLFEHNSKVLLENVIQPSLRTLYE